MHRANTFHYLINACHQQNIDLTTAICQLFNICNNSTYDTNTINDFEYENEDNISVDLKCPICLRPVVNPILHDDCGNMFCKQCFDKSLTTYNKCPVCNISISKKKVNPVKLRIGNAII